MIYHFLMSKFSWGVIGLFPQLMPSRKSFDYSIMDIFFRVFSMYLQRMFDHIPCYNDSIRTLFGKGFDRLKPNEYYFESNRWVMSGKYHQT